MTALFPAAGRPAAPATPPPLTDQAEDVEAVWTVFLIGAVVVAAVVFALIAWSVVRHRRRDDALPEQVHYNIPAEVAYTVIPLLIVAGLFVITYVSLRAVDESDDDPDLTVDVTAFQWQWQFEYPASGVSSTGVGTRYPELVLPAERTVQFNLTSPDVLHSFWVPGFRYKRDVFPEETMSFQADIGTRTGYWENSGVCAEFCGLDHHQMRFSVRIVTPDEFEAWLEDRRSELAAPAPDGDP